MHSRERPERRSLFPQESIVVAAAEVAFRNPDTVHTVNTDCSIDHKEEAGFLVDCIVRRDSAAEVAAAAAVAA